MKVLFIYSSFQRHAQAHPELLEYVPMNEYLGSPSLGLACLAAVTPPHWEVEFRDDRLEPADRPTDANLVAFSFFTAAASRAMQLGDYFRAQGKPTVAGGIFPTAMPEVAAEHFDSVVVGEGDGVWPTVLADVEAGALKKRYERVECALGSLPLPKVSMYIDNEGERFHPDDYPVQLSRGCPLNCHSCILPVSMTKSLREYPLDHVIGQLDQLKKFGKRASLTEDTSWLPGKGNRLLSALFDHLVRTGQEARISYVGISMPMIIATPMPLLEKARKAGVTMFYLVGGFDPVTMRAFTGRDPKQLERAHQAIAKCHDAGIEPYTSFLYGQDDDDEGTVDRMLEFAAASGIRKAEFAIFTPYPGTPSWKRLVAEDRILHTDWSRYNDANCVYKPKRLSPEQVTQGYLRLWRDFYADKKHFLTASHDERTIQF
ncbi:MAG: radical SAM protein [Myxococcota bacterium]|jgi:radical SAM superfamily enzyme YgiQ (UPF0313 family)